MYMRIYSISSCEWVLFNANSAIFQLHFCISWWEQHLETYCFCSVCNHFENGRHLENFENAELLL
jgi:hypothetical protein